MQFYPKFSCTTRSPYFNMEKMPAYIDSNGTREFLFTYDEEEKQDHEINRSNASLVFSPKFIPIYPDLLKNGCSLTEALIFGFIDFYKSTSSERFYFTNDQISEIVNCNPDTVSRAISNLETMGLLKTSRKVRAGGGLIRFVTDIFYKSELTKDQLANRQKLQTNKNKINENNINNNKIKGERENTHASLLVLNDSLLNQIATDYEVPIEFVRDCKENMELWLGAKGKTYKDYNMALRNWVKKDKYKVMYDAKRLQKGAYVNPRGIDATQL